MDIHVVRPGDTLYSIAQQYGVSMARLLEDNDPPDPARLSVGQTLVVRYPKQVYRVRLTHSSGVNTTYLFRIISKIQICPFCFFTLYSKGGKFKLFTRSLFIFSYFQQTTITITQKTKIVSQGVIIHFVPIFPNSCRYQ